MNKLKLLSTSFIMALTLAAPFATYAMEPGEDHIAVATKQVPLTRKEKLERQLESWEGKLKEIKTSSSKKHNKSRKIQHAFNIIKEIQTELTTLDKHKPVHDPKHFDLYTYLRVALDLDTPILEAIYHSPSLRQLKQFERFLNGKLIYKPNKDSDEGMVVMPIADLVNPLNGEFDLSKCGDAAQYFSINTGYRKGRRPENKDKVEIWFAPRSLIEKNLSGSASHFKDIMGSWDASTAPVGMVFTWGNWDNLGWYDYVTTLSWESYNDPENNLRKIGQHAQKSAPRNIPPYFPTHFHLIFDELN